MQKKKIFIIGILAIITLCYCIPTSFNVVNAEEIVKPVVTKKLELHTGELPSSYKTVNIGNINDQGYHGDCWAFGALATLQINMKKMGFVNENSPDGFYDFAESPIVKYGSCRYCYDCHSTNVVYDKETNIYSCGDCGHESIVGYKYGDYNSMNESGSFLSPTINYLISNPILTDETNWQYNTAYPVVPEPTSYPTYSFQINSVYESEGLNIEEIKRMVYSFGSAYFGHLIYERSVGMSGYEENENTYLTFCGENIPIEAGHAVAIIGYDDNFSKNNFKINKEKIVKDLQNAGQFGASKEFIDALKSFDIYDEVQGFDITDENFVTMAIDVINNKTEEEIFEKYGPKTDGAFLIKNSWGILEQSNTGCYWVPYDQMDEMYNGEPCYSFTSISSAPVCDKEYFYDELGARYAITNKDFNQEENNVKTYSFANVFNFEQNSKINYVSLSTGAEFAENIEDSINEDFEYKLFYAPVVNDKILTNQKVLLKEGIYDSSNYYQKIFLNEEFIIPNEKGAIIIEIPTTEHFSLGVDVNGENDIAIALEGQSFMLVDGEFVQAKYDEKICNYCLRVGVNGSINQPYLFKADYTKYNKLENTLNTENRFNITYTSSSWAMYEKARQDFMNISQNLNVWQQQELDDVVDNYLNAYNNLKKDSAIYVYIGVALCLLIYATTVTVILIVNRKKTKN